VAPTSFVPLQVTSGPAMVNIGPSIVPGSPKADAVMRWLAFRLQVSLAANRLRVVSRGITEPTPGVPGVELMVRMMDKLSVWLVRL
jgi:hypothetical protein